MINVMLNLLQNDQHSYSFVHVEEPHGLHPHAPNKPILYSVLATLYLASFTLFQVERNPILAFRLQENNDKPGIK